MGARSVAITLLLAGFCGAAAAQAPAQEAKAVAKVAKLRVEERNLNLGTIHAGEDAVATFVFHNDGDVPVKILRAKPG